MTASGFRFLLGGLFCIRRLVLRVFAKHFFKFEFKFLLKCGWVWVGSGMRELSCVLIKGYNLLFGMWWWLGIGVKHGRRGGEIPNGPF